MITALLTSLFCSTLFFPGMVYAWSQGYGFWETIGLAMLGGTLGFFFYGYLGEAAYKLFRRYVIRRKRKRVFSKYNRFVVRVRSGYGLLGIAFITPIVKNPLGFAVGMTITNNRKKLFLYMFTSMIFWAFLACGLYFGLDIDISQFNPFE